MKTKASSPVASGTTPRSSKGEATRRKILEAAVDLIYRKGFNATSIDDVLAVSGTGKSQFYHYFGSKEQLVRDIVAFHLGSMPAVQQDLLAGLGSLRGIDTWLEQIEQDHQKGLYQLGCPIGNLASELAGQSEDLRLHLESTFSRWEDALAQGLKAMKARGELRGDISPESLALFAVSAIEGALLLAKTHKDAGPLKATLDQIKAHVRFCATGATAKKPVTPRKQIQTFFCP
jgi:AcrR family transcriptional regulator